MTIMLNHRNNFILCLSILHDAQPPFLAKHAKRVDSTQSDRLYFIVQDRPRNRTLIFQKCFTTGKNIRVWLDIHFPQKKNDMTHWQSHHAGVTSLQIFHGMKLRMLDRICTSLIKRVASCYIGINLLVRVVAHRHVSNTKIFEEKSVAQAEQSNSGINLVCMPT